jgi:hypothetical protein
MIGSIARYINHNVNSNPPTVAKSLHVCPFGQYLSLNSSKDLGKFLKVVETELLIVSVVISLS